MQIILAGSAKVYQMAAYFGFYNYWLAVAEIRNGANGGGFGVYCVRGAGGGGLGWRWGRVLV